MHTQRDFDEMQLEAQAIVATNWEKWQHDFLAHRAARLMPGRAVPPGAAPAGQPMPMGQPGQPMPAPDAPGAEGQEPGGGELAGEAEPAGQQTGVGGY